MYTPFVLENPHYRYPRAAYHVVAFGNDKGAIAVAFLHLFKGFFGLIAIHNVFKRVFFDIADYPFLARSIAWSNVAPWINKEEVGECAACRTIASIITS